MELKPAPKNDPEPDPRQNRPEWIKWFRRTQMFLALDHCSNLCETRKDEWDFMDAATR